MKRNTKKLLLSLYRLKIGAGLWVADYLYLQALFPELSAGGLRSIVKHAVDAGYVQKMIRGKQVSFLLTGVGREVVQDAYFRWFNERELEKKHDHGWLVFYQGMVKYDRNFVKLRRLLEAHGGVSLFRGVYYFSTPVTDLLKRKLLTQYAHHVTLLEYSKILFGAENLFASDIKADFASNNSMSGVIKELGKLLDQKKDEKGLTQATKKRFSLYFSQIEEVFGQLSLKTRSASELQYARQLWELWERSMSLWSV